MKDQEYYESVLKKATERDFGNPFVASCRRFLKKHKFLSHKQLSALNDVRSRIRPYRRPKRSHNLDPDWDTNEVGW